MQSVAVAVATELAGHMPQLVIRYNTSLLCCFTKAYTALLKHFNHKNHLCYALLLRCIALRLPWLDSDMTGQDCKVGMHSNIATLQHGEQTA